MSEELTTPEVEETVVDEQVVEVTEDDAKSAATPAVDEDADEQDEDDDEADEDDDEESDDPLDAEGDVAADYLEELLDIADLDGDIDTYSEGGRAHISIVTESQVLVGKDGEVLDALQELARLAVMTETGHRSRLMLDIAGHRDRRRKELQVLAHDAIAEVKTSGEAVRLSPMNPAHRALLEGEMRKFLFERNADRPAGYVPEA